MGLTIGKVASSAGVGVETVRFYERRGLIARPERASGYRQYTETAVARIRFIRRAQELGFTLNEIRELMVLEGRAETCEPVRGHATAKIETIAGKIRDLQRMKSALERMLEVCEAGQSLRDCPIMNCLEKCTHDELRVDSAGCAAGECS